jgi:hypothetical protein
MWESDFCSGIKFIVRKRVWGFKDREVGWNRYFDGWNKLVGGKIKRSK